MDSSGYVDQRPRRVLIAGCGYVGCALGLRLASGGAEVWGIRRDTARLPASIRAIPADVTDVASLRKLPGPFDVVFYTTGASEFTDAAYHAAYVEGLSNVLAAVDAAGGARRILFTSSTAVYAQNDGGVVNEESETEPQTFSGSRVLEGERMLLAQHENAVVFRLAGIYGPGRTGLIDRVRRGEARRESGGPRYLNLIHLNDVVGALEHLANLPSPDQVYVGVDDVPQDYSSLVAWIAERLRVPVPAEADARQTRGRPVRNRRCSNARLRASGYQLEYPDARAGYAELIGD